MIAVVVAVIVLLRRQARRLMAVGIVFFRCQFNWIPGDRLNGLAESVRCQGGLVPGQDDPGNSQKVFDPLQQERLRRK